MTPKRAGHVQLQLSSHPVSSTTDFEFGLWDAATGIMPECVSRSGETGTLMVDATPTRWAMVNALQEQQAMITAIQQEPISSSILRKWKQCSRPTALSQDTRRIEGQVRRFLLDQLNRT